MESTFVVSDLNQLKISTNFAFSKLDAVEAWDAPQVLQAHSAGARSIASTTSTNRIAKRNIARTEPCFITNESSYVHARVHWFSDVDRKEKNYQEMRQKFAIFLCLKGIVGWDFTLDHPSNLTHLHLGLDRAMNEFGMFTVTCNHATLDAMINILERENEVAKRKAEVGTPYIRDLEIWDISDKAEYEVVVLRPKHFLPLNTPIRRYIFENGVPLDPNSPKSYKLDDNGVLREAPLEADSPPFPSFRFTFDRERGNKLNPYLVILAAEIKFRRSPEDPQLDAYYEALITKTIEVADLLYWEPEPGANTLVFPELINEMSVSDDGRSESQSTHNMETGSQYEDSEASGSTARPLEANTGSGSPEFASTMRYLLSGTELPLDDDDLDLLWEIENAH